MYEDNPITGQINQANVNQAQAGLATSLGNLHPKDRPPMETPDLTVGELTALIEMADSLQALKGHIKIAREGKLRVEMERQRALANLHLAKQEIDRQYWELQKDNKV